MRTRGFHSCLFGPCLSALALGSLTTGQVGSVLDDQKIGQSTGGFAGSLVMNDGFGRSVAPLGDLDGDGVEDLLVGVPHPFDSIGAEGRIFVLFLEPDGSVREEVEIAAGGGAGFVGPLGATDRFGWSVARLGDLTAMGPPGSIEIAVGASGTDIGGSNRGAVWILSLDAAGSVVGEQQLFGLGLANEDQFGSSVCALDDLDSDGVPELVVGARLANDGASDAGAIWVLRLNSNGTIKAQTRISQLVGGFSGAGGSLAAQDNFGAALDSPGDMDGDGVADLFVGAPGDSAGAGAVWVLYLNATTGSVKATHRIAAVPGVDPGDRFGESLAALGDLDLAGGLELAVGAPRDDDGLTDRGAAWIVFLDAGEAPLAQQKISDTEGAFDGALNGGLFGFSLAPLGDLDGDGRLELAVGEAAAFAPPAQTGTGAVWILSLVGPQDSVWTGAQSTDWFDPLNWSDGLPGPALAAVIRDAVNDPVVGPNVGLDAECLDLALASGASLSLPDVTERLTVHQDVRVMGFVTGVAELCLAGDGSLMATSPIQVPVVVDTAGTVQLRGSAVALQDGLQLVAGQLEVCDGCLTTVVGTADFGSGVLTGGGTLDIDGSASFVGTDVAAPPTLCFSGDVEVDAAFVPTSGCVVFDGAAPQTITQTTSGQPVRLFEGRVDPGAEVSTPADLLLGSDLDLNGHLDVGQVLDVDGSLTGSSEGLVGSGGSGGSASCILVAQDMMGHFGVAGNCMFELDNPFGLTVIVDYGNTFPSDLIINSTGIVQLVSPTLTVGGKLQVLAGTFQSGTDALITVNGVDGILVEPAGRFDTLSRDISIVAGVNGTPVTVRGELRAGAGGALLFDDNAVSIESGGTLKLEGSPSNPARMDGIGAGGYQLSVLDGANLQADHFRFERMGFAGVRIVQPTVAGTVAMDNGLFNRAALNGTLLDVERPVDTTFDGIVFQNTGGSGQFNVRVPSGSAEITFTLWSGAFGGPAFEDDPFDLAGWGAKLDYFLVREGVGRNRIAWQTSAEPQVVEFVLDRRDLPSGSFGAPLLMQPATGGGLYSFVDTGAGFTPGQPYEYRLRERLQVGAGTILSPLAAGKTDGMPNPPTSPTTPPSSTLPLVTSDPHAAPAGFTPLPGGFLAPLHLAPGRHALPQIPRTFRGALRITGDASAATVLDASAEPLLLRGLRADQSLELADLEIDAGDPGRLALVIEDCAGALLLERVAVRGQVRLGACARGLLQRCVLDDLTLERRSQALLLGGEVQRATLTGASRLTSQGLPLEPTIERGSHWSARSEPVPWLEGSRDSRSIQVRLDRDQGTSGWLSAAPSLSDLLHLRAPRLGVRMLAGELRQVLPPELATTTLYLRATTLVPETGARVESSVLVLSPGP